MVYKYLKHRVHALYPCMILGPWGLDGPCGKCGPLGPAGTVGSLHDCRLDGVKRPQWPGGPAWDNKKLLAVEGACWGWGPCPGGGGSIGFRRCSDKEGVVSRQGEQEEQGCVNLLIAERWMREEEEAWSLVQTLQGKKVCGHFTDF